MFLFVCCCGCCCGSLLVTASSVRTPPLLPLQLFNLGCPPRGISATTHTVCPLIRHLCLYLNPVPSQLSLALITTNYPQQKHKAALYCSVTPTFEAMLSGSLATDIDRNNRYNRNLFWVILLKQFHSPCRCSERGESGCSLSGGGGEKRVSEVYVDFWDRT